MKIELNEAIEIVRTTFKIERTVKIPILESHNCILKDDIISSTNQPPFRRSAMDGYAINSNDVIIGKPIRVECEIDAGDTEKYNYKNNTAYKIMTGAPIPEGCDLVIPQEMTDYGSNEVIINNVPNKSNICQIGEDYIIGERLISKNQKLNSNHIAIMASNGIKKVEVYDKCRVSIIITGNEVVGCEGELKFGQIFDSNSPYLASRLKQMNCTINEVKIVEDDLKLIAEEIKKVYTESDFIITVGGVSVGNKDLLEECMNFIGADILFHGIDIKPGMPTMYSIYKNKPILSLSGNPFAASSLFELLFPLNNNIDAYANLNEEYKKSRMSNRIVRGRVCGDNLEIFENQTNGSVSSGSNSNCLAILPKGKNIIDKNTKIKIKILV